jgi:hypothetical protein
MDFLFFLLPSNDSPEGLWVRVGDHFAGCVLRVEKAGSELVGRILVLPEAMTHAGWLVGDLKWRNIRADGPIWRIQDLRKHYDTRTATVTRVDYQEYHLTVGAFGHLRLHTGAQPFFPAQRWVRQESPKPSTL